MTAHHRDECRKEGVDFPKLVALVVPRLGIVEWARADLDVESIKTKIVNFVRFNPRVSMNEVVSAFKAAYPDLKPDDVMQKRNDAVEASKRQAERQAGYIEEAERILGVERDEETRH